LRRAHAPRYNGPVEWLWVLGVFVAYVVLTRWVLPRLGVPT